MTEDESVQTKRLMFRAKEWVARTGDKRESAFLVISGLLTKEHLLEDGRRQIVGLHVPGDVCGLSALTDGRLDHDLLALSPVSCMPVPLDLLSSMTLESGRISRALWHEMTREIAMSAVWITNIGQRTAYQRMAHFLCELEARLCVSEQDANYGLLWPGTQTDLSALTGLSVVHVNRTLRQLERDGLLSRREHDKFLDIAKLRDVAGFDPSYLALGRETLGSLLLSRMGDDDPAWSRSSSRLAPNDGPAH